MRDGNILCPDLSLTLYARLPNGEVPEGFGDFAPDLCIEVISPSEAPGDIRQKLQEYFDAGRSRSGICFHKRKRFRSSHRH